MATKSDFAQKLLHDLRLRKERMGAAQGSARSHAAANHATARDAYRDPGTLQRGSRQSKTLQSIAGSKSTNQQLIPSRRSNQPRNITDTSQQIVTYTGKQQRHQRSESISDLSMAFNFAVKNGGKLMNMDFSGNTNTVVDFLQQIGRRSIDSGNTNTVHTRNGTNRTMTGLVKQRQANGGVIVPALTSVQIKEISKGVQNLYEIIRSSSNGSKFDPCSAGVGNELLKGAKGLEESLRMLVSLQETSEMMVKPQRKSRITLLEVGDDEVEDDEGSKQVALPRFSFDKPCRKSNSVIADGVVRYPAYPANQWLDTNVSSVKPNSNRSEKGRISNVIAKLMGLEEIPVNVNVDSDSRRDDTLMMKPDYLSTNTVRKSSKPVKDSRKLQQVHDSNTNGESKMNQISKNNRSDRISKTNEIQVKQSIGELKEKVQEKVHSKRRSEETMKSKSNEIKLVPRNNQVHEQERRVRKSKQESQQIKPVKDTNSILKESKTQSVEGDVKVVKDSKPKTQEHQRTQPKMVPVTRKKVDLTAVNRNESPRRKDEVLRRNRKVNNLKAPIERKPPVFKEPKRNEVVIRSQPEAINNKGSSAGSNANKTDILTEPEEINTERSSSNASKTYILTEPEDINTKRLSSNANKTDILTEPVDINTKRLSSNAHKTDILPGPEEINTRRSSLDANKTDILPEPGEINTKKLSSTDILQEPEEINTKRSNLNANKTKTTQLYDVLRCENEMKNRAQVSSEIVLADKNTGITNKSNLSKIKPKKTFYSSIQVVLTDQEKQLKEILIKDQLFLSTAEALFKLNIPVGLLHVDDQNRHENETKLKLDCGYEILKRKARSQELSLHPYAKPSIGDTSIRFLDELVKQLYKDLEGLRVYNKDPCNEYNESDYLQHMLEKDIHNSNPDINSFWDFGWHITTFTFVEKEEFVSDVERDTLRILVDEIVYDLLNE